MKQPHKKRAYRRQVSSPIRGWSLRTRILACLFLPVSLLLGSIGFVLYRGVSLSLENQLREEVELIARALSKPVAYSLERNRNNSLVDALKTAFDFERVYGAYLYDLEGDLIAQAHHQRVDKTSTGASSPGLPQQPTGSYETHFGEAVFSYFVPLEALDGSPLGMLQVTRSGTEMRAAISRLQRHFILGYSFFLVGFTIFLFILYYYSIYRPVRKLHTAIRRITPGKRHERLPTTGGRELAELGFALNEMLAAIESQQSQLSRKSREGEQLKRRLRNSEQLAALGEMAASIGHEIGTPLATIDGYAQRGLRKGETPTTQNVLESIRGEVGRIEAFIRELLSFGERSQSPAGPIDFETALSEAVRLAEHDLPGEISLEINRPSFPDGAPVVRADPVRMRLVLKNIVTNALQSKPGANVRCGVRAENHELVCCIDDDGPGIPPAERERIFAPFATRRTSGGIGLGLALADRIVHDYGGSLRATSSPCGGARLVIHLPIAS